MPANESDPLFQSLDRDEPLSPQVMESLYAELRRLADTMMVRERNAHTLQPTALVHEAFLRLVDSENLREGGETRFLSAAAVAMRRVLVDHARGRNAEKRGGNEARSRITLSGVLEDDPAAATEEIDITALDAALTKLATFDKQQARLVELRFFGGMTGEQIAKEFGVSRSRVVRDLAFARAWLKKAMQKHAD